MKALIYGVRSLERPPTEGWVRITEKDVQGWALPYQELKWEIPVENLVLRK